MYRFSALCLFLLLFAATTGFAAESTPFERGIGLYNDNKYDEARKAWEEGEAAGDMESVMALATHIYSAGRGAAQNDRKAFALYQKAARSGDAEAMNVLAVSYFSGTGTARDNGKGLEWERKAAEAGSVEAAASLGDRYAEGDLLKKDPARAVLWHTKAAEAGAHTSQIYLGRAYMDGRGVARDSVAARAWLSRASAQGSKEAERLLRELAAKEEKRMQPEAGMSVGTAKDARDAGAAEKVIKPTPEEERAAAREERAAAGEVKKTAKPVSEGEKAAGGEERAAKEEPAQSAVSAGQKAAGKDAADLPEKREMPKLDGATPEKRDAVRADGKDAEADAKLNEPELRITLPRQ